MANRTFMDQPRLRRFPLCSRIGGIVGAIVGMMFGLVQLNLDPTITFSLAEVVGIGLILGVVGWLCVLLIVGGWLRYGIRAIAIGALVISLVVGVVVVAVLDAIGVAPAAMLLGLFLGTLVGALICWLLCVSRSPVRPPVTGGG